MIAHRAVYAKKIISRFCRLDFSTDLMRLNPCVGTEAVCSGSCRASRPHALLGSHTSSVLRARSCWDILFKSVPSLLLSLSLRLTLSNACDCTVKDKLQKPLYHYIRWVTTIVMSAPECLFTTEPKTGSYLGWGPWHSSAYCCSVYNSDTLQCKITNSPQTYHVIIVTSMVTFAGGRSREMQALWCQLVIFSVNLCKSVRLLEGQLCSIHFYIVFLPYVFAFLFTISIR